MNGYNFTDGLRRTLQRARDASAEFHHQYVGPEHILLGVLQDEDAVALLGDLAIRAEAVRAELTRSLKPGNAPPGDDFPYTTNAKRVLEYSMHEARELSHSYIGTEHLLLAIVHEGKSPAAELLHSAGLDLQAARAAMRRRAPAPPRGPEPPTPLLRRVAGVVQHIGSPGGYNFTDRTRKVLQMAREEAARLQHEYVGTEHILLGLVREGGGVACAVLANLNVELEAVVAKVDEIVKKGWETPRAPDLPYTSRAKKVLEFAMSEARELNHSYVGTEHLLLGLLREAKGIAAQVLTDAGVSLEQARAETLRLLTEDSLPGYAADLDRRFKAVLALIELHQRRFGSYPDELRKIGFLSPYDSAMFHGLTYEKLPDGYALDIVTPPNDTAPLSYPAEFWRGLGIRRTNVHGF